MTDKHKKFYDNAIKLNNNLSGVQRSLGDAIVKKLKQNLVDSEKGSLECRLHALEGAIKGYEALQRLNRRFGNKRSSSRMETCAFDHQGNRIITRSIC